jgi:phospholipid-binding lipoprotein MlaA
MSFGDSLTGALHLIGWTTRGVGLTLALSLLSGCAIPPPADDQAATAAYVEANDPLEPLNRSVFAFNRMLDTLFIKPAAEAYRTVLPAGAREGVRNVLNNLDTPNTLINDMFQGEVGRAGESAQRIVMNTLGGAGGLVDVAAMDNSGDLKPVPYHSEDFGQTLAVWGFGEGPYLMLPLFGPSNVRDLVGRVADGFLDPTVYLVPHDDRFEYQAGRMVANGLDKRANFIDTLDDIERNSIDFYATIRSLYRQNRQADIANGKARQAPAPEISELAPNADLALQFDDRIERTPRAAPTVN